MMFKECEIFYVWTGINNEYISDSGLSYCVGYTGCLKDGMQCFQIIITEHGKTGQNDHFHLIKI